VSVTYSGDDYWAGDGLEINLEGENSLVCLSASSSNGTIYLTKDQTEELNCRPIPEIRVAGAARRVVALATVTGSEEGDDSDNAYMSGKICYESNEGENVCCDSFEDFFDTPDNDYMLGARDVFANLGECQGFSIPIKNLEEVPKISGRMYDLLTFLLTQGTFSYTLRHEGTDPWAGPQAEIVLDGDQAGRGSVICSSASEDGVIRLSKGVEEELECIYDDRTPKE